jgi:hypothetical protein
MMAGADGKLASWDRTAESVCKVVADVLQADPATCQCYFGANYLKAHSSPGDRIVFVPVPSIGDLSVRTMGNRGAAKYLFAVEAHIWGASSVSREGAPQYGESGRGWGQQRAADRILADLLAAWHHATGGRANAQTIDVPTTTMVVKFGEDYVVPLTYEAQLRYVDNALYPAGKVSASVPQTEIRNG